MREDLTGLTFNDWTVLKKGHTSYGKNLHWICICNCGTTKLVRTQHLKTGKSKNCGCKRKIKTSELGKGRRKTGCTKVQKFKQYKKEAKNRNLVWDLSFEYFLSITSLNCHYCGVKPGNEHTNESKTETFVYQGIDRFDSSNGYVEDNCVPCCYTCNRAKMARNGKEFLDWILQVYIHSNKSKDFPAIDYSQLGRYETEDNTEGAKTLACTGGTCEI